MEATKTTLAVQQFLDELAATDSPPSDALVRALLGRSVNRLRHLCGGLLYRSYPRLTHGPAYLEADDVLAAVVERLLKALCEVKPASVRQFFALANRHIRWELNDLARRIDQQGTAALPLADDQVAPPVQTTTQQTSRSTLIRILTAIDALPEAEREVFECVRIQGMTHPEAGSLLGVSEKTIQRRLRRGVLMLAESLRDLVPAGAITTETPDTPGMPDRDRSTAPGPPAREGHGT